MADGCARGHRSTYPRPSSAASPAPPPRVEAAPTADEGELPLLRLQRTAANRATTELITIQRDNADLSERDKIDEALRTTDFLKIEAVEDFRFATVEERLRMIGWLATVHKMNGDERDAVHRLWESFGDSRAVMTAEHSSLWDKCQSAGARPPKKWQGGSVGKKEFDYTEQVGANVFGATAEYSYRVTEVRPGLSRRPLGTEAGPLMIFKRRGPPVTFRRTAAAPVGLGGVERRPLRRVHPVAHGRVRLRGGHTCRPVRRNAAG